MTYCRLQQEGDSEIVFCVLHTQKSAPQEALAYLSHNASVFATVWIWVEKPRWPQANVKDKMSRSYVDGGSLNAA